MDRKIYRLKSLLEYADIFIIRRKKNFEICMKRKILVPMKKKVLIFLIKTRKNNKEV